jgi:putative ABC transport system permease protein
MKKRAGWIIYFVRAAIMNRRGRFLLSVVAVAIAIGILSGLYTLSRGIRQQIGGVLKAYGANLIISRAGDGFIREREVQIIKSLPGIESITPQIYLNLNLSGTGIDIIGTPPDTLQGFRIDGIPPRNRGEIMIGKELTGILKIEKGSIIKFDEVERPFTVTGIYERGGPEDRGGIVSIETALSLRETEGYNTILARGVPERLDDLAEEIMNSLPGLNVKTLKQVSMGELNLLRKMEILMILVTIVIMISSGVGIASSMGANVLERREEIGLLKALGATPREIGIFFLAEMVLSGIAGGLSGFVLGMIISEAITRFAFGSFITLPPEVLPLALLAGVLFNALSGYAPVKEAMRYSPAEILRGE